MSSYDADYPQLNILRMLAWAAALVLSMISAIYLGLSAFKETDTERQSSSSRLGIGLIAFIFVLQQIVFFATQAGEVLLIHVSAWVSKAPIRLIWLLYFFVPLVYVRPLTVRRAFRSYATAGWIFVLASIAWSQIYRSLSEKHGVPVSWSQVEELYYKGEQVRLKEAENIHANRVPSTD